MMSMFSSVSYRVQRVPVPARFYLLILLAFGLVFPRAANAQDKKIPDLNEKTFRPILRHILPSKKEKRWKKIGWIDSLEKGIKQAKALQRPILLWTMNGHPLGHT